jgi:hypothetical protein
MSKVIYICFRDNRVSDHKLLSRTFEVISNRLVPDNIIPNPVKIIQGNGIAAAIINPVESIKLHDFSICLGALMGPCDEWYRPHSKIPDGNFALFRGGEETVEVITDVIAGRTIWYYHDSNIFIASTSQRAIIILLSSFLLNKSVVSWMLSSGTLGYKNSWDTRIQKIDGDSKITLDRVAWKINLVNNPVEFHPHFITRDNAKYNIKAAYKETFENLELRLPEMAIALSGGYDSRLVFLMLKDKVKLYCTSWGYKNALYDKYNDAYIAKKLAEYFKCEYHYNEIEIKEEFIHQSLTRLLVSGEGRTDNVGAYLDEFQTWKRLFEMNQVGLLRGDLGYNSRAILSEQQGRQMQRVKMLTDYKDYSAISMFGFEHQEVHDDLKMKENESLITYSFRMHHMYNLPYSVVAWTDIMCPYVELINPLFSKTIITAIRKLPDDLLYMKSIHSEIVKEISPPIDVARHSADLPLRSILYNQGMVYYLIDILKNNNCEKALPKDFIDLIIKNIRIYDESKGMRYKLSAFNIKNSLKKYISTSNKQKLSAFIKSNYNYNMLALRAFIIIAMTRLLDEDSQVLDSEKLTING